MDLMLHIVVFGVSFRDTLPAFDFSLSSCIEGHRSHVGSTLVIKCAKWGDRKAY